MHSKVFKLAHKIKGNFETFSNALKAAWRLVKMQLGYKVDITFANSDGELRDATVIAIGSMKSALEKGYVRFVEQVSAERTQWRSFRLERLIFKAA